MNLEYIHKPDYYFFAQLFVRHIEKHIKQHPKAVEASFHTRHIQELFQQDQASTTINLDGILGIADEYSIETLKGDMPIIQKHRIDAERHILYLTFNAEAIQSILAGHNIIEPVAGSSSYPL
ncbi:hypothetical protein [Acinetobacter rudis]|uniref:Uncharacterized protein n=1 Tax=Acinetobacter rudis TaxID=632955 RepID=A0AAW8J4M1_9GAMM|nr:hypothetical protein [Acinetobacter rudis]MDQ8934966.1 hypothetical protein [Acinetobacter rudis]MDQ8954219.1 hypothetical protein [Acinetobacter rudis]MDQ9017479.1 hypothetical protein [Acinetobacter rudis]